STDIFVIAPEGQSMYELAMERAHAYFEAGADCILVQGLQHPRVLRELANSVDGPVGVSMGMPTEIPLREFAEARMACVALGSSLMRSMLGTLRQRSLDLASFGDFTSLHRGAISANDLDALLLERPSTSEGG
ncbi:MAG: isocitrate lyase/phosphoenolpyruvate mutase family protein, partial [Pseudomonadota bacterium]|nr:isocitrate lyase/phosphoenolpyruvate mutase family protein [Pseudomonadota bacterium]